MVIEYANEEIRSFILHGEAKTKAYKRLKSNATLRRDLDRVMVILETVTSCEDLERGYKALHYEQLKHELQGYSCVRIGFKTKFRLIFTEGEKRIRISLIEISEHYGDK